MPEKRYKEEQIIAALRKTEDGEKIKDVCRQLSASTMVHGFCFR